MSNYFSKNLKFLREKKRISKNKLGEMVGVNQTTIGRWENGQITPSIDNVEEVARVLNVELPDLLIKDLETNNVVPDKLEILFKENKDILNDNEKETIGFIIEKRKKEKNKS